MSIRQPFHWVTDLDSAKGPWTEGSFSGIMLYVKIACTGEVRLRFMSMSDDRLLFTCRSVMITIPIPFLSSL